MAHTDPQTPPAARTDPPRQSGRAALLAVLGISLFLSGAVLLTSLQAPTVSRGVVIFACVLMGLGCLLLPIAWMGRRG